MSKRVVLIVAGAALAAAGAAVAVGGGAVMVVVGQDSSLASGPHRLATSSTALVTPMDNISDRGADLLGRPSLRTTLRDAAKPVFIGVGPAREVDAYLAGAAVETVEDLELDPYDLTTTTRAGAARPAAPATESFWVARSDGSTSADLTWKIRGGDYRLVVMNADASPGVNASSRVALHVPHLFDIGATVLAVGLVVTGLGGALVVVAFVVTRGTGEPPAGTPTAPVVVWQRQPETVPPVTVGDQRQG